MGRQLPPDFDPDIDDPNNYPAVSGTIQQWISPEGYVVQAVQIDDNSWELIKDEPPNPSSTKNERTAEQQRADAATATSTENKNTQEVRDNNERSWNQQNDPDHLPETHLEKAERKAKQLQADRAEEARIAAQKATATAEENRTREAAANRAEQARQANQSAGLTQQQIDEQRRQNEFTRNKPEFLTGDSKNPYTQVYNPATNSIDVLDNPNFDAVKDAAEQRRLELASQVQSGQLQLEAAKQQYTQWFDTNVKTPLMLSQEARAKAEEQRQALEAEERRRQFAADFGLRKATLGQAAGQDAAQNEISLLPYRSGPTWGADISSAINSLAGGGSLENDASAGIHFSDSSFSFQRPDFKQIAKDAAKAALSGLTDYRPSDDKFATGDYSGVPAVNLSGAPAPYTFNPSGAALPPPSPEYTE
jgi:hypothetical protein